MTGSRAVSGSLQNNYGSGSSRPKNIRIRILNTACELYITAMSVNNVFCQVTVKEATVNTIVAAEVAGWFFIGKNNGRHSEIALRLVSVFLLRKRYSIKDKIEGENTRDLLCSGFGSTCFWASLHLIFIIKIVFIWIKLKINLFFPLKSILLIG